MTDLTNYYRNLCEQLQQQIELVEKKIAEKKKAKKKLPPKGKKQGKEEQADKDYDGDGEVESKKAEYFGSKDKAIKKAMAKKKTMQMNEGRNVQSGQFLYGGFPRILNEVSSDMYEETKDGVVDKFNDGDDAPGDEKIATHPDSLTGMEAQLEKLQNVFDQAESDLSDSDSRWSGTEMGRKMRANILDLERKIRAHPQTQAKIASAQRQR